MNMNAVGLLLPTTTINGWCLTKWSHG